MTDLDQTLKGGQFLVIETGDHSDRSSSEPVRIMRDFVKRDVAQSFIDTFKPEYKGDHASPTDFLPWLVKNGYVEDVEGVHRWHVGSYGRFEP